MVLLASGPQDAPAPIHVSRADSVAPINLWREPSLTQDLMETYLNRIGVEPVAFSDSNDVT